MDDPTPLSHLDARGAARMVDVADRPATDRSARAEGFLRMDPSTLALVSAGAAPKGDVLAVARVAAIQGAKRTAELIPLCHPLPLAGLTVTIEPAADGSGLRLEANARTTAPTGVEMEALTAVQIGLLTLYDMLKAADPAMTIGPVRLVEKHGGRHGSWRMAAPQVRAMAEPFPPEGLPLQEARGRVLEAIHPLPGQETLPLAACLRRVSAETCHAREAVPGFRASIMDGYATADGVPPPPESCWRLVGRSAPGAPFPGTLGGGEAIRILTGAPLPEGAARVLPQELVERRDEILVLIGEAGSNPWIRAADEEAAPGQRLLEAGVRLGPAHLGRLASCGVKHLAVRPRPRVGLLISGDELVPAGEPRGPGTIWESNGTLLEALLVRLGQGVAERRVVADEPAALAAALEELAAGCDVVVSTGGVSAGDTDWIRPLLAERGEVAFWKLFLKPGRPFAFGQLGGKPFFGLPGNPVAAAITALQLLWPALEVLEGTTPQPLPRLMVRLETAMKRSPGRPELARARLLVGESGELLARVAGSQASSRIGSLEGADLLLEIPAEQGTLEAGTELWAQLLRLPLL